jgi:D-alanyl-D-alanine carboxypeptidase
VRKLLPPVVTAAALAVALTAGPSALPAANAGGGPLQRDLNAVHAAGVTGALAEARTGHHTDRARAGVADLGTGRPVSPRSYLRSGSITKTYVATVILSLAADRRLSLDDPVERWLPGVVQGNGNDGSRITVRHLLQHTSGIYDYAHDLYPDLDTPEEFDRNRWRHLSSQERVAIAMRHRPNFAPGTGWSYSNTNYVLAGMLIKAATGRSWEQEVHHRILKPLKLTHTITPDSTTALPAPHPTLYQQFTPGGRLVDTTLDPLLESDADGSITTTTADLNRFFQALIGGRLLPRPQLAAMQTTVPADDGSRYGLGLRWRPLPCGGGYWTHGGNGIGYTTLTGATTSDRTVTISLFSRTIDPDLTTRQDQAARHLINNALCR